jgi:hypothetical protein
MQHPATILTPQQLQAIDLFGRGQSVRCIAEAVGVSRETLWRWRQLEHFAIALQEIRQHQHEHLREQVAELVRLSMLTLTRELKKAEEPLHYNPVETAFKVLHFISASGLLVESAPARLPNTTTPTIENNAQE